MTLHIVLIVLAYLAGSISSAILTCKVTGKADPRQHGSKNPGATNVMRLYGKKLAVCTLLGDVAKGFVPVIIAIALGAEPRIQLLVGFAAFLGHLYPVFFGFKGGKGVATIYGVLFALNWQLALIVFGTWIAIFAITRISSLSALIAFLLLPVYSWFLTHSSDYLLFSVAVTCFIFWRHRSNIQNLISGAEK